jgi:hypothetical protein
MIDFAEYVYFDQSSPTLLRWACDRLSGRGYGKAHRKTGDIAGGISGDSASGFYFRTRVNKRQYLNHVIIWSLAGREVPEGYVIDHINGDSLDSRIENLRVIPASANMKNIKKRDDNTSGVNGVSIISNGTGSWYCSANWQNFDGKPSNRRFSINNLGIMVAFRDAVIHRAKMIEQLNLQGAGYTERHGK